MPLIQWRQIASSLGDPVDLIGVMRVTGSLDVLGAINLDGESLADKFTSINNTISTLQVGSGSVEWSTVLNKPAGLISSSAQITALGFVSESSGTVDTSSLVSRLDSLEAATSSYTTGAHTDISALNTFTGSANTSIVALNAATASYLTSLPNDIVSSSAQITALGFISESSATIDTSSLDSRLDSLEAATSSYTTGAHTDISALNTFTGSAIGRLDSIEAATSSYITSLPGNIVSSSTQITDLGFISESSAVDTSSIDSRLDSLEAATSSYATGAHANLGPINTFTASADGRLDSLEAATSSYLTSLPNDIVSSSTQITALGFISESSATIDTSSLDSRLDSLEAATSSYTTGAHTDISALNTFTGSAQTSITALNNASSSYLTSLPSDLISGSAQITALGFISESSAVDTSSIDSRLDSLEAATSSYNTGPHTDISALNTFSASAQTSITALNSATSSYLTSLPNNLVSGSDQFTASYDSRYLLSSSFTFDGNRNVTNDNLPTDIYNNNFGTSGSVHDFLEAVFFPNNPPSITTGNQTIEEFTVSGSTIVTLAGSDPDSHQISFTTASSYTADIVRVENGDLKLNQKALTSFNTVDRGDGTLGHPVDLVVTDQFGATGSRTIYITIDNNAAPVFRIGGTGGSILTTGYSASRREDASSGTVADIYFTDEEGDTITITSASDANGHFSITKYSNYVRIAQVTGSLDYENITSYNFSVTASDEHAIAGDDTTSIKELPITITVTDNLVPTINNQTLTGVTESAAAGTSAGFVSANDPEGLAIVYSNFTNTSRNLDGVDVGDGTYSNSSQTDPSEDPFQINSGTGQVTLKNSHFLNSDLINQYKYNVTVSDAFNETSNTAEVTIDIKDDLAATLTDNWSAGPYIVESAESGANIKTNSDGFNGNNADYGSNQTGTWTSSNAAIGINSNGTLTLATDLSASATQSGATISSTITFTNTFGTTTTDNLVVQVTDNQAPTATFTDQSSNFTASISAGTNLVAFSISDAEGDSPYEVVISGNSNLGVTYSNQASSSGFITASQEISSAGIQGYTASIVDDYSNTTAYERSFTAVEAQVLETVYIWKCNRTGTIPYTLPNAGFDGLVGTGSSGVIAGSPMEAFISGAFTGSSFSVAGGFTANLVTASLQEDLQDISNLGNLNINNQQAFIIFPDTGSLAPAITSMRDSFGGTTSGEYVLYTKDANSDDDSSRSAKLYEFNTLNSISGSTAYKVIASNYTLVTTAEQLYLVPSSGSSENL